ncbi:hypothetical protein BC624_11371 [Flavobacterium granuli]|uniref:Uncharacterized protein n=1 Tax=Flavobacterium granuli TaxID=280093 RepID=A0A1M5QHI3_9FLAO|nr:hypothetical protein BC624_11371 [Flavobacterium granuli]SHH13552.1 hypothetical protein SAMN05443373_1084 [Flavobacterium granuli]
MYREPCLDIHVSPKKKVKEEKIPFDPLHILYILNSLVKSQPTTYCHPELVEGHNSQLTVILSLSKDTTHDSRFTIHISPPLTFSNILLLSKREELIF